MRTYCLHCYSETTGEPCPHYDSSRSGLRRRCLKHNVDIVDAPNPCPHQPTKTWVIKAAYNGDGEFTTKGDTREEAVDNFNRRMIAAGFLPQNCRIVEVQNMLDMCGGEDYLKYRYLPKLREERLAQEVEK